jgi:hypothetical protein
MQDPFSLDEKLAGRANLRSPEDGGIAQLVERLVRNEKARGSNPLTSREPRRGDRTHALGFTIDALTGA